MIDSTQSLLLNAAYGRAILLTHVIEQRIALQVALWHMLKSGGGNEAFSERYSSLRKATLGRLLKIGLSCGALSQEDGKALEHYRKLRNLLVHEISESVSLRLLTKMDSVNVIAELNEIADDFEGMSEEILKSVRFLFQVAGGDLDEVEKRMAALLNKLSGLDVLVLPNKGFERDASR